MDDCCCGGNSSCSCPEETGVITPVSADLSRSDVLGAWKARWGIGRMDYKVNPGLYALNNPDSSSPVLVSANYKLSFDTLRKNLSGLACWILVLDTKGINVWCAAGKGTFGTTELVNRVKEAKLSEKLEHRTLILPQLGAPGIIAREVTRQTGFSVVFGPVRAADIKEFLSAGMKATKEMRTVKFTFYDRSVVTPMEIVEAAKYVLPVFGVLFILNLFVKRQFGLSDVILYFGAKLAGCFFTPLLLPFIPGRAFAFKGWLLGLCWAALAFWLLGWYAPGYWLLTAGYGLLLPAISSFLAMNFTGASTYTSPSGVLKEMRTALPFIIVSAAAGAVLILIKSFTG